MDERIPGDAPISFDSIEFSRPVLSLCCTLSPDVRCPCLQWFPRYWSRAEAMSAALVAAGRVRPTYDWMGGETSG